MSDPQKSKKLLTKQDEQANFNRCVESLKRHLQEQRSVLSFENLNDQQVNKARELARTFVIAETGPDSARHIYDSSEKKILALGSQGVSVHRFPDAAYISKAHTEEQFEALHLILELLVTLAQNSVLTRKRRELAQQLRDRASDYIELLGGEPWGLAKEPTSEQPGNTEIETQYLDLTVDAKHKEVGRKGYPKQVQLSGPVAWPMFLALFNAKGALLSRKQVSDWPGERKAARRSAKARLNEKLRDLEVVIPDDEWRLVDISQT